MTSTHVAQADCERCRPGPVAQPVNTVSSLAFVVAGVAMVARASRSNRPRRSARSTRRSGAGTPRPTGPVPVTSRDGAVAGAVDAGAGRGAAGRWLGGPLEPWRAESTVGWAAVAAGLGSVAYHGPGTAAGRYLHDASLISLLTSVVLADAARVSGRSAPAVTLALVPLAGIVGGLPRWSMPTQVVAGVAVATAEALRAGSAPTSRVGRWRRRAEAAVAGAGALGHVLGRSDGPLCRPDSRVQAHALWHAAMATTLSLRAFDTRPAQPC